MIISNITPPQVWTASSRSLTNFGSGALAPANTVKTTVAASGSVDLRSSAGIVGMAFIGIATGVGATAAMNISINDGTNHFQVYSTAAASNVTSGGMSTVENTVGPAIFNTDGAVAGFYMTAVYLMTI